jgi:RHS repeat-associated protein
MSGDAATNPLRFNGFDYDSAVKTYDMQARDYRPSVGRFLQSDRYESAQSDLSLIADPLTQNRYDFAGNDPVDSVEFDGHIPGAGTGCQPRCGDNQGGNITTAKSGDDKGNSTNIVTPAASGSTKPKRLDNPAAAAVVNSSTPKAQAAARATYQRALNATQESVKEACLERCAAEERAHDISQVAGAVALGLEGSNSTLNLQGMDRPIAGAEPDNSPLNPVNLFVDIVTGGTAIGVKAGVEALLQRGAAKGAGGAFDAAAAGGRHAGFLKELRRTFTG